MPNTQKKTLQGPSAADESLWGMDQAMRIAEYAQNVSRMCEQYLIDGADGIRDPIITERLKGLQAHANALAMKLMELPHGSQSDRLAVQASIGSVLTMMESSTEFLQSQLPAPISTTETAEPERHISAA